MKAGYQVPFAQQIRDKAGILTGAVGMIQVPEMASEALRTEKADVVIFAREFLRRPYWPLDEARNLGIPASWPVQYLRAAPDGSPAREALEPVVSSPQSARTQKVKAEVS